MNLLYAFNLIMAGIMFGWGISIEDSYLWFGGIIMGAANILPFIPWGEDSP